ncbi:hypothetical protein Tco_1523861 [Tanacetum coccineum]
MCFNSSTGLYNCQLDEQWFNLHKDILKDALDITLANDNNPFEAPPSSDTIIEYVNTLGYPSMLRNVSVMSVNALYQPWRAIMFMINMCLTGKTVGFDRPRHPVLQILWGITHHSNIDYAKRMFTKLIIHHLRTKHNIHPRTGLPLHYLHEESILNTLKFVGKDGREVFGMPIPDVLLTDEITSAPYYNRYLEHVAEYQRCLDEEQICHVKSGKLFGGRDAPSPAKRSNSREMEKRSEMESDEEVSLVINVGTQDKGQAGPNPAQVMLFMLDQTLETLLDFGSTNASTQQNPEKMDEEFTTTAYPSVQENLKLPTEDQVRLEEPASSARTLSSLQNLDKELSFTNQFLVEKSQEYEPDKSNTEAEVQSMVTVPIHQDTFSVPLMTTPVIDLTMSQPVSITVQAPLPTSTASVTTITTTTSLPPPPP